MELKCEISSQILFDLLGLSKVYICLNVFIEVVLFRLSTVRYMLGHGKFEERWLVKME